MAKEKAADTKAKSGTAKASKASKKDSKFNKFFQYFKDLRSEIKKVVWPTKKQIWQNTSVVLTFLAIAAALIWLVDYLLSLIMNLVF